MSVRLLASLLICGLYGCAFSGRGATQAPALSVIVVPEQPKRDFALCVPGQYRDCMGINGCHGVQMCMGNGAKYETCSCTVQMRETKSIETKETNSPSPEPETGEKKNTATTDTNSTVTTNSPEKKIDEKANLNCVEALRPASIVTSCISLGPPDSSAENPGPCVTACGFPPYQFMCDFDGEAPANDCVIPADDMTTACCPQPY